jgi:FeS assembly SUF system regulator
MLKISKLTDYGLLASVYLARRQGDTVSAREVAEFCHLPVPVVSKVLKMLQEGGIVQSFRGAGGGYSLQSDPESITLANLLEVLEGPWELVDCETVDDDGHAVCGIRQGCPSRSFMFGINRTIKNAFDMVTLGDLLRGGRPKLQVAPVGRDGAHPTV